MREIKFRAWNKDKNVRVYDNEDESRDYWDGVLFSNVEMVNHILKDKDYIWMQYTGLKDKNGKEIFFGDKLKVQDSVGMEFTLEDWLKDCNLLLAIEDGTYQVEVIGNIYEN